jgi:adenylate cyclase, class 2
MSFEVEQKFAVPDLAAVEQKLMALGARADKDLRQVDGYLAHPCRDFGQTDEALRLRSSGGKNYITYKGPKIDATTKTRRELELDLPSGADSTADWGRLLGLLGFRPVADVSKHRRTFLVHWQDSEVEVALDEVDCVGTFVELELQAEEQEVEAAQRSLAALAERLELTQPERRSYLELLLLATGAART